MANEVYEYENLQEIEYGGLKIIVEAARRDSEGNTISTTYAKKSEVQQSLHSGIDIITINGKSILTGENLELYNKSEIDSKFNAVKTIKFQIVQSLPETGEPNIIYLVPEELTDVTGTIVNIHREYVYVAGKWELLGKKEENLNFKTINGQSILVQDEYDPTNIQLNVGVHLQVVEELPNAELAEENTFYLIANESGSYDMYGRLSNMSWVKLNESYNAELEGRVSTLENAVENLENSSANIDLSSYSTTDETKTLIPAQQATTTLIKSVLTNIHGTHLENPFAAEFVDTNELEGIETPYYEIKYNNLKLTETQSKNYMEKMTGSRFLPVKNINTPQNSIFIMENKTMWRPEYDAENGFRLYKLPDLLSHEQAEVITKASELDNDIGFLTKESLKPAFIELNGTDLDEVLEDGRYKITNAVNYPRGGSAKGTLVVDTDHGEINEEWTSDNIKAFRNTIVTDVNDEFETSLFINGVEHTESVIHLAPEAEYTLSGTLNGSIIVDAIDSARLSAAAAENSNIVLQDTTLILNNVKIKNIEALSTIKYLTNKKNLKIILKENTKNYIFNMLDEAAVQVVNDDAVICSLNDVIVTGAGGLSIESNNGVHGIKGTEVHINGNPTLRISALHDCIHGSRLVDIQYGTILLENGNDGIEAKNSSNIGVVRITGGDITIKNCRSNSINSATQGIACGASTKFTFVNNHASARNMKFLQDVTIIGDSTINPITFETYYGIGHVYNVQLDTNGEIIEEGNSKVEIAPMRVQEYLQYYDSYVALEPNTTLLVEGYFSGETGKRIIFAASGGSGSDSGAKKGNIILKNAYIDYGGHGATITYYPGKSRLSVKSYDGTINYIKQSYFGSRSSDIDTGNGVSYDVDYDAIKSENGLELTGSGTLYVSSAIEDAVDGSEISLKGDGPRYFINSGCNGIKATRLYFGGEKAETATIGGSDKADYTNIYAVGNGTCAELYTTNEKLSNPADIYCRNGSRNKGWYTVWPGFMGVGVIGSFNSVYADVTTDVTTLIDQGYTIPLHTGYPLYVYENRLSATQPRNFALSKYINTDEFLSAKEIAFTDWKIFFAVPSVSSLDPSKNYVLGFKNGKIKWLTGDIEIDEPESEIPENAVYDEDGNIFVDAEGNYLLIDD